MTSDSRADQEKRDDHVAKLANVDAAQREAYDYWGYLFKKDKCGTPKLDRLLKGIAAVIVSGPGTQPWRCAHTGNGKLMCASRAASLNPPTRQTSHPHN